MSLFFQQVGGCVLGVASNFDFQVSMAAYRGPTWCVSSCRCLIVLPKLK